MLDKVIWCKPLPWAPKPAASGRRWGRTRRCWLALQLSPRRAVDAVLAVIDCSRHLDKVVPVQVADNGVGHAPALPHGNRTASNILDVKDAIFSADHIFGREGYLTTLEGKE